MIIIRCVSVQLESLACHVTRANAAFTVCTQLAHQRTGVVGVYHLQDVVDLHNTTVHIKLLFFLLLNSQVHTIEKTELSSAVLYVKYHNMSKQQYYKKVSNV